jgi:hypothetical protein
MNGDMKPVSVLAGLLLGLSASAFGQAAPPAASSLEDVSGCALEGEHVFVTTGRDATARRYKYPWDASLDALCNAKGYAIGAPSKGAAPAAAGRSPSPAPATAVPAASGAPREFPPDAVALSKEEVAGKITGRTFDTQLHDGPRVRLEYKASGYLFVNAPGYANSGPWRAEDGRICSRMRNADPSCNEVRELGGRIYLKRDNGDVIALTPQ